MSTKQSRSVFIEELCKYFMDFLQSGFKSTRFPKRYIRLTNEKNFKIGIDLSKYENFNESIRKGLNKPDPFQQDISVKKGTHTVKLNNTKISKKPINSSGAQTQSEEKSVKESNKQDMVTSLDEFLEDEELK